MSEKRDMWQGKPPNDLPAGVVGQVLKAGKKGERVLVRWRSNIHDGPWVEGYFIAAEDLVVADLVVAGALQGTVVGCQERSSPQSSVGHFLPPVVMEPGGRMTTLEGAVTLRIEVIKAALIIVTDKTVAVNDELKRSAKALLLSEFKSATRNNEDGQ